MKFQDRHAITLGYGKLLLLMLMVGGIVGGIVIYGPSVAKQANIAQQTSTSTGITTAQQTAVAIDKPIQFGLTNPLATSSPDIGSAVLTLYNGLAVIDGCTTGSSGTCSTAKPWPSGDQLTVKVVASSDVTRWIPFTVPTMTQSDAQSLTTNFVGIQTIPVGTVSIKVNDEAGNQYIGGTSIGNFTKTGTCTANNFCLGVTQITFTVSVFNTASNTGWASSQDPIAAQANNLVLQITSTTSAIAEQNLANYVLRGTNSYWSNQITDGYSDNGGVGAAAVTVGGFSEQTIGSTSTGGIWTEQFSVTQGSLAHGATQTLTAQVYTYASIPVFSNTGAYGPNAATLGSSFGLKVGA
jgi:hypothetical protein